MILYDRCPVCNSMAISKVLLAKDHTVSNELFEIWQCAGCSLRFTQNIPSEREIGRYYQSDAYISHSNSSKGLVNRLYLFARQFTLKKKRKFIERITGLSSGTVLDIGAGTGAFLHEMKNAGWKVEGLEPDPQAIANAEALHKVQLRPSDQLFTLPKGQYQVITMWHVLEHVHELHKTIAQITSLCSTGGRIIIAVPNYTSYDATRYDKEWAAYDVPRHLYHFSPASMQVLMQLHGCTIVNVYPMWLDSLYVSLLSEKYCNSSLQVVKGFWYGLLSNRKALANKRKASSLIYEITVSS